MPFRLAMLGVWHVHAPGMFRQIIEHPAEFSLAGFYDPESQVRDRRFAEWSPQLPGLKAFDTAAELLDQPLDGVLVEGRVSANLAVARQALERGLPVLLEKPAGTSLQEFQHLAELARSRRLHLQMAYLFRWLPVVREIVRRARQGELGAIYEFRGRLPKELPLYAEFVETLGMYRGGIFFEMAGHLVDLMIGLLGTPRNITPFLAHHHAEDRSTFCDNGIAIFEFERAFGTIEVNALETVPESRRVEVLGTKGGCVIPHLGSGHLANRAVQTLQVVSAGESAWRTLELDVSPLQISDLREFVAVVRGEKTPEFSLEHDLLVQESLLRASGMV